MVKLKQEFLRYTLYYVNGNKTNIQVTKKDKIISIFAKSVSVGGGILNSHEIAFMLEEPVTPALTKLLSDYAKKGILRRVAKGVFESTITPPNPATAIYKIIKKLRGGVLSYISLESQLSYTGEISQVVMDRVTVVTKGRSGVFSTPYGVIEFTHTKKAIDKIAPNLYFDSDIAMYRASTMQAIADLKDCGRNTHMLEG